jgi:hypothetical protein
MTRNFRWAPIAVVIAAALGLAACGGSGSSSSTAAGTTAAAKETSTAPAAKAEPAAEVEAGGEAEAGGAETAGVLTPPGTVLKLGEAANVTWVPPGEFEPEKSQSGIELEVTVESIEEGSVGDLKNIELEAADKGAVPFYVHLKLTAPSAQATPAGEDPALSFEAIDDRRQPQSSLIFLGAFPTCEEAEAPKHFAGGASYETCLTYPMNGGGSIEKVEWNSGPAKANQVTPYYEHPLVWEAEG